MATERPRRFLCGACFELSSGGDLRATYEDDCPQDLDHDGTCDPAAYDDGACQRYGKVDRLHPERESSRDPEVGPPISPEYAADQGTCARCGEVVCRTPGEDWTDGGEFAGCAALVGHGPHQPV